MLENINSAQAQKEHYWHLHKYMERVFITHRCHCERSEAIPFVRKYLGHYFYRIQ